jgi:hypothetical protein
MNDLKIKDKFSSVNIADLHVDAVDPKKFFKELESTFINYIKLHKNEIDLINILGDYFNSKISLTSQSAILALKFINSLCTFCHANDIELRIIKGTKTHDFNQLDNYKYLEKKYKNFKIYNQVTEEEIKGIRILYVPEEYMNDQNLFYKEYKEKEYDLMFGHGTFDVFAFQNQIQESERNIKGSPVFYYQEWHDVIKYNIIFGHIHVHNIYKKLEYCGSYTRWIHGEEKPKGFIVNTINLKDETSVNQFIENPNADSYITVNLSSLLESNSSLSVEQLAKLSTFSNDNSNIKLKIDTDMSNEDIRILKETFSDNDNMKIEVKSIAERIVAEEKDNEFSFLTDSNNVNFNIQKYIEIKNNVKLTEEEIIEITSEIDD